MPRLNTGQTVALSTSSLHAGSKCPSSQIVKPENASADNLPEEIEMEFGRCVSFAGKVGESIQMAVRDELNKITGRYVSACSPWR